MASVGGGMDNDEKIRIKQQDRWDFVFVPWGKTILAGKSLYPLAAFG